MLTCRMIVRCCGNCEMVWSILSVFSRASRSSELACFHREAPRLFLVLWCSTAAGPHKKALHTATRHHQINQIYFFDKHKHGTYWNFRRLTWFFSYSWRSSKSFWSAKPEFGVKRKDNCGSEKEMLDSTCFTWSGQCGSICSQKNNKVTDVADLWAFLHHAQK